MRLALIETTEAIGAKGLHDTDIDIGVVVTQEGLALYRNERGECVQIMIEQLLAQLRWEIGLCIE